MARPLVNDGAPPRVSVLLPVRDGEATLPTALASLARQTESRFECVLVDDGSRDATPRIAQQAAAADPRIRWLRTPPRGLVAALSAGLAACRAPFIARLDADDWMHRERLARQLAALDANPGWAGVGCHVRMFPRRTLLGGMRDYERWLNAIRSEFDVASERFIESPLAHPTWLMRRSLFERFAYRDCGWPEDYDWLLRVLGAGHRIGVVPHRLVAWRDSERRLTRSAPAYRQARITECKAAHLAESFLQGERRYVLWGHGGTGRALRRALAEHGADAEFVVELHPRRIGRRIHGAPVVAPEAIADLPRLKLIASVAGAEPRRQIRSYLAKLGYREPEDFVCAA